MFKTIKKSKISSFDLYKEAELKKTIRFIQSILDSAKDKQEIANNRSYYENLEDLFAYLLLLYTEKYSYHKLKDTKASKSKSKNIKDTLKQLTEEYYEFRQITPIYHTS